ncbi:MAG: phosphonoacetaldehyde reductase [Deltaproteobacteria bacterium]|nr:phosphonoacetaldehyde reductase [Deltaproteobacteria bacterium]
MTQAVHLGTGAVLQLRATLERLNARSVFLVTGKASFELSGAAAQVHGQLSEIEVWQFNNFSRNPEAPEVERGLAEFHRQTADAVVAVGGGSTLDVAKLIALGAAQGQQAGAIWRQGQAPRLDAVPVVAIPTTAGSGSEATHFATVYAGGKKRSVAHPSMLPVAALVDPALTASASPKLTAVTGLDAFSQAVESFWSVHSTAESRGYSRQAITLVQRHLLSCVRRPAPEHRAAMCQAAHLAGKAINITKTTAPHALSYALTSRWNVPHGHAAALTLGAMLVFNSKVTKADVADPRGDEHVRATMAELFELLGCDSAEACREKIATLMRDVGLATRLGEVGVRTPGQRGFLVEQVNLERLHNNPRALDRRQLREVLESVA